MATNTEQRYTMDEAYRFIDLTYTATPTIAKAATYARTCFDEATAEYLTRLGDAITQAWIEQVPA